MYTCACDKHIYLMYYFCIGTSYHVTKYHINNLIIDRAAHVLIHVYRKNKVRPFFYLLYGHKKIKVFIDG